MSKAYAGRSRQRGTIRIRFKSQQQMMRIGVVTLLLCYMLSLRSLLFGDALQQQLNPTLLKEEEGHNYDDGYYGYYLFEGDNAWEGDVSQETIDSVIAMYNHRVPVHVVISHCDKPLDWIASKFNSNYVYLKSITIISKCGNEVVGAPNHEHVNVISLPNVGRCDHSYAYFISHSVVESNVDNDVIFFIKDNDYQVKKWRSTKSMLALAHRNGIACATKEKFGRGKEHRVSFFHNSTMLGNFGIKSHTREGKKKGYIPPNRKEIDAFVSSEYSSLGNYADEVGIRIPSPFTPVCYGGEKL